MAMPGMGTSPSAEAGFPALAVVLALFMIGYIMWTTDQLASLVRAKTKVSRARPEPCSIGHWSPSQLVTRLQPRLPRSRHVRCRGASAACPCR